MRGAQRWTPWPTRREDATTSCLRSFARWRLGRHLAKSRTRCVRCSANTGRLMSEDRMPDGGNRMPDTGRTISSDIRQPASGLLSVQHLTTLFDLPAGPAPAVIDVSFDVNAGETLCLVGESGSGKSVTAFSILNLVQPPGRIAAGRIMFKGRDLRALPEREMQKVRGA